MTPDATKHNPSPDYLRALLDRAGVSQRAAARRIGVSERVMRYYLADEAAGYRPAPYPVQFALEALAAGDDGRFERAGELCGAANAVAS
jgi:transcriptional regulator with XRE-family HTH domain